jgi:hypothetical protein
MVPQPFVGPPRTGDQQVSGPLRAHRRKTLKSTQRHPCPHVGFETTVSVFGRAKTVHALHRMAAVNGLLNLQPRQNTEQNTQLLLSV